MLHDDSGTSTAPRKLDIATALPKKNSAVGKLKSEKLRRTIANIEILCIPLPEETEQGRRN